MRGSLVACIGAIEAIVASQSSVFLRLNVLFVSILVIYVFSGLLGVLLGYVNQVVGQGVMVDLRQALHSHLQRLSVRFYTNTRTGEILSRISTDVNAVQMAVTGTFRPRPASASAATIARAKPHQVVAPAADR